MSDTTANLALPFIMPAQAQKHVSHNEALDLLDIIVQLSVQSDTQPDPPATPALGARYALPVGSVGLWAGHDHEIAAWTGASWTFVHPRAGWQAYVIERSQTIVWTGTQWRPSVSGTLQTEAVGINATADPTNRLSVSSDAVLLNHAGGGHQLKINKSAESSTGSLLFQTNWSGRAEMGCTGEDAFTIKASADGAGWATAMRVAPATGIAEFPQGLRCEGSFGGTAVLGTVSQDNGASTGALFENGDGPQGSFMRFANGLQICQSPEISIGDLDTAAGAIFTGTDILWAFPAPFAAPPHISTAGSVATIWCGTGGLGTGAVTVKPMSHSASTQGAAISITAIGRWIS